MFAKGRWEGDVGKIDDERLCYVTSEVKLDACCGTSTIIVSNVVTKTRVYKNTVSETSKKRTGCCAG